MRIAAVARNTFKEAVRDKVLYVLLFFAAATIFGSKALGWISVGQDIKIVKDISLAAMSIFGVLIAIFIGTNLIYKEIDKRTLYTIISQPMHRYEFILGKYCGLATLLAVAVLVMTGTTAAYVALLGGTLNLIFFQAVLLLYMKLLLLTAIALLLSSLSSPILGAIVLFCIYVVGHATGILKDLPPQFDGTAAKTIMEAAYYVIPNLSNFDVRAEAANNVTVSAVYVLWALLYGAVYTCIFLLLAGMAFSRKDV